MRSVTEYIRGIGTAIFRPRAAADAMGLSPAYDAASSGRRTLGWNAGVSEVNALISGSGDRLRSYSRDLVRKNPWARSAVDSIVSNCVGTGIRPVSLHPDPAQKKLIQDLWRRFVDQCDPAGNVDFYGMQAIACRETAEAGEILARKRIRRVSDRLTIPLQIQLLESEHLPYNKNAIVPGGFIQSGVEFNLIGQKVAYWLWKQHPGSLVSLPQPQELTRVPAESVVHSFKLLRANQLRGEPWLTQVLIKLHELGKYDDAEVVRKNCAAMIAFIVEENDPNDPILGDNPSSTDRDDAGVAIAPVEPGSTIKLRRGETMKTLNPADVGGMYEIFMRTQLQACATSIGTLHAYMSGDYTGMNFTTIRAAAIESRRKWEQYQFLCLNRQFNQPIWNAFIEGCVKAGELSARAYEKNADAFLMVDWRPEKWDWVDPLKDVEAEERMCRAGFKARSAVVSDLGYDPEEVDRQIKADAERGDKLALRFDSDGRNAPASGKVAQSSNTAEDIPQPEPPAKSKGQDSVIQ